MTTTDFWIQYIQHRSAPSDLGSMEHCNAQIRSTSSAIVDLNELSQLLRDAASPAAVVRPRIHIAQRDSRELYDETGERITEALWSDLEYQSSAELLDEWVRPGFTVRRADVRTWPSEVKAFKSSFDREFDQFQETALHTFEPVIVLSKSQDGEWVLVESETYQGWVRANDVAVCDWDTFDKYTHVTEFIVMTGPNVYTQAGPYHPASSGRHAEFAAVLPLSPVTGEALGNQSEVGHYRVDWPVRGEDGALEIHPAFISRYSQVHEGFLPFTREHLVTSAFALLSERYGWGDSFGCHDCSSLVMDSYRTMGIQLPRNADTQETATPNTVPFPDDATLEERSHVMTQLHTGDPLYMAGHTMLYLGEVNGRHYVIHDFAGYAEALDDGTTRVVPVNEIMVSTLDILTQSGKTYLDALTSGLKLFG